MGKKIEIEEWLKSPQHFISLRNHRHSTLAKQIAYTNYFFLSQVTRCHKCDWLYGNKALSLFNETRFTTLCEDYRIKIELMKRTKLENLKLVTDSSTIFTYLDDTERAILMIMGEIGVAMMMNKEVSFLCSSFEESVFSALGYKTKNDVIYLR